MAKTDFALITENSILPLLKTTLLLKLKKENVNTFRVACKKKHPNVFNLLNGPLIVAKK